MESVPPGSVELQGKNASYDGKSFRWFEQDTALVACVLGEFYWKVDPGEQVWMTDYVRPPEMLSREITHGGPDSGEISWSRAVYICGANDRAGIRPQARPSPPDSRRRRPSRLPTGGCMPGGP